MVSNSSSVSASLVVRVRFAPGRAELNLQPAVGVVDLLLRRLARRKHQRGARQLAPRELDLLAQHARDARRLRPDAGRQHQQPHGPEDQPAHVPEARCTSRLRAVECQKTSELESVSEPAGVVAAAGSDGDGEVAALARLLGGRRFVALTGAGCSTESGIPDYRGPPTGPRRPFNTGSSSARRRRPRYWARAPSAGSVSRRAAQRRSPRARRAGGRRRLAGVITQNVDGLHSAAGSRRVVELHGALADVRCLACGASEPRRPAGAAGWRRPRLARRAATPRARRRRRARRRCARRLRSSRAPLCGGVLKPDVVFFGERRAPRSTDGVRAVRRGRARCSSSARR